MSLAAALLIGMAVAVLCASAPLLPTRPLPVRPTLVAVGVGLVVLLVVSLSGTSAVLALIGAATAGGVVHLIRVGQADRAADSLADQVLQMCDGLAAELRSGQPPQVALEYAAERWRLLEPVATAGRLDADVPGALRGLAHRPGARELHRVAAAWQVSQTSGAGLAASLSLTAEALREQRATARLVAAELAAARATAHLMLVLPIVVLLLGAGIGGDPVGFLLHSPVGLGCLAVGVALGFAGLAWLHRIGARVLRR